MVVKISSSSSSSSSSPQTRFCFHPDWPWLPTFCANTTVHHMAGRPRPRQLAARRHLKALNPADLLNNDGHLMGKGMENPLKIVAHIWNTSTSAESGNFPNFPNFLISSLGKNADLLAILQGVEVGRSSLWPQIRWGELDRGDIGCLFGEIFETF